MTDIHTINGIENVVKVDLKGWKSLDMCDVKRWDGSSGTAHAQQDRIRLSMVVKYKSLVFPWPSRGGCFSFQHHLHQHLSQRLSNYLTY